MYVSHRCYNIYDLFLFRFINFFFFYSFLFRFALYRHPIVFYLVMARGLPFGWGTDSSFILILSNHNKLIKN